MAFRIAAAFVLICSLGLSTAAAEETVVVELRGYSPDGGAGVCSEGQAGLRLCVSEAFPQAMNCGNVLEATIRIDGPHPLELPVRVGTPGCAALPETGIVLETAAGLLELSATEGVWRFALTPVS